jgi:hypothetical protein
MASHTSASLPPAIRANSPGMNGANSPMGCA